jgi:uncharacterized membrane protein YbhN (UPF0104 family)
VAAVKAAIARATAKARLFMQKKYKKIVSVILKLLILAASYLYIYYKVKNQSRWDVFPEALSDWAFFVAAFTLMPLNWLIESYKWQYILKKTQKLKLRRAAESVFAGITLGIFTPNRIGELAGRILVLKKAERGKGVFSAGLSSLSQTLPTLLFGIIGVWYIWQEQFTGNGTPEKEFLLTGVFVLIFSALIFLIYFRINKLAEFFGRFKLSQKLKEAVKLLTDFSKRELSVVLSFSMIRYPIFMLQLYLLLLFFGVQLPFITVFAAGAAAFLVNFIIPGIALADIGIRGSSALFFFGLFISNEPAILSAVFALWLINLVIPAIIGSVILLRLKIIS